MYLEIAVALIIGFVTYEGILITQCIKKNSLEEDWAIWKQMK